MAIVNIGIMFGTLFLGVKDIVARVSHNAVDRVIFVLLACAGFGLLFIMGWYAGMAKIVGIVSALPFSRFALLVGFMLIVYTLATARWLLILRGYGYSLSWFKLFATLFKAATVSMIFPSFEISGETYKAYQLQKLGVSKPAAFASVFFEFFAIFIINAVGGLLVLGYVMIQGWRSFSLVGVASTLAFIALAVALFVKVSKPGWFTAMVKKSIPLRDSDLEAVGLFDYGISFFLRESRPYLIAAIAVTCVGFVWEVAQIGLVAWFLGIPTDPVTIAVLYVGVGLFNSVPVFGGIGFGEAGAFLAGASVGIPDVQSLSLMFLLRVRQIAVLALGSINFIRDALDAFVRGHHHLG